MKLDSLEYYTLSKLIHFVKFNCKDIESINFAGSPIIGEVLRKVMVVTNSRHNEKNFFKIEFGKSGYNLVIEGVKANLERVQWNDIPEDLKETYIKELMLPYYSDTDILMDLLKYANNFHQVF